jgi:RHS repeat-associated protein
MTKMPQTFGRCKFLSLLIFLFGVNFGVAKNQGSSASLGDLCALAVNSSSSRTATGPISQLIPSQSQSFTVNDRLTNDTYDANGNTLVSKEGGTGVSPVSSSSVTDVYSFDNRLIRRTTPDGKTIDLTYTPDGHRLSKFITQNGLTQRLVHYLTDANNPTGYAQVIEEKQPLDTVNPLRKVNLYGHDLIATESRSVGVSPTFSIFYSYDGLGSVRSISNATGDLQETYDYDAYGTLIGLAKRNPTTGVLESSNLSSTIPNLRSDYLYTGEQWDADLGMYFLRARYLNTNTGRFHTQDTYEGRNGEPLTLHKYLYANGNPAMFTDPSGKFSLMEQAVVNGIIGGLANATLSAVSGLFTPSFYARDLNAIWKDLGVSFATGAVGGGVGTVATKWLAGKIVGWGIRPFIKNIVSGAFGGAAAGFSTQLATEIYEFTVNQRPISGSSITEAGERVFAFTMGGLITGGIVANVRITGRENYKFSLRNPVQGLAAIPFDAMTGSREVWNIIGLSGVTGGNILGNLLTYYYSEIYE